MDIGGPSECRCARCGELLPVGTQGLVCPGCAFGGALGLAAPVSVLDAGDGARPVAAREWTAPCRRIGDYDLLEEVARGGMGVVYKARQRSLHRVVAVKVILAPQFAQPEALQRLRNEAEVIAHLKHPNIVAVYEVGQEEGQPYFSMEYVEGRTLADAVREQPLPAARAAAYLKIIAEALNYAHRHGVLHRDLKPSNVLIDENDQPRLTDFGLAKRLDDSSHPTLHSTPTLSGQVLGTPSYLPPEQALGRRDAIGPAIDVYALGALLYHLITRRPPFLAETLETTLALVLHQDPVPPRLLNSSVPPDLETICLKCLSKEPSRRYPTAQALADDLGRFLRHEPIRARPVSGPEKAWRWCKRKPVVASLAGGLVLACVLGTTTVLLQWQRAKGIAREESQQRQRAQSAEFSARQYAYVADMRAAQADLQQDNLGHALTLLRRYLPKAGEPDFRDLAWRYLWQQSRTDELQSFGYPEDWVQDVALSPDGRYLATTVVEMIRIWDLASKSVIKEFPRGGTVSPKKSLGFAPDGSWLATPGAGGIEIRETVHWSLIRELRTTTNISPVAVSADGMTIVSAGFNGFGPPVVQVWDLASGACRVLRDGHAALYNLAVSPDGSRVAYSPAIPLANRLGPIAIWDRATAESTTLATNQDTTSLALSPDGKWLASGHYSGKICWYRLATREVFGPFPAHRGMVYGMAFAPDSTVLATGGNDQVIRLWRTGSTNPVRALKGHESEVYGLAFSRDGQILASGSKDGTARLWSVQEREPQAYSFTLPSNALPVGPWPDGRALLTRDVHGRTTRLWRLPDGEPIATCTWDEAERRGCQQMNFLPRNQVAVGITTNGTVHLWDLNTGRHQKEILLGGAGFNPEHLSSDNRWLLGTSYDPVADTNGFVLCDLWNSRRITSFAYGSFITYAATFSPDNRWLAFSCSEGGESIRLWDLSIQEVKRTLWTRKPGQSFGALSMACSPDGKVLACGGYGGEIRLWSTATGAALEPTLKGHMVGVGRLAFSADGKTLASDGGDLNIRLWDMATRQEMLLIQNAWIGSSGNPLLVHDSGQCELTPADRWMLWRETQGNIRVTPLPSLVETDARDQTGRQP